MRNSGQASKGKSLFFFLWQIHTSFIKACEARSDAPELGLEPGQCRRPRPGPAPSPLASRPPAVLSCPARGLMHTDSVQPHFRALPHPLKQPPQAWRFPHCWAACPSTQKSKEKACAGRRIEPCGQDTVGPACLVPGLERGPGIKLGKFPQASQVWGKSVARRRQSRVLRINCSHLQRLKHFSQTTSVALPVWKLKIHKQKGNSR